MFWAFGDSLDNIKWRFSLSELIEGTQIKTAESQIRALQDYETLSNILRDAFGGSKSSSKGISKAKTAVANAVPIKNRNQLAMALGKLKSRA